MWQDFFESLEQVKQQKPIVLCLTNSVTQDFVANTLLAVGASPIMSCSLEEIEELVWLCHSVYINIGTLHPAFIDLVQKAVNIAKQHNKPIILDPVGAGASLIRTETAMELLPQVQIIRGNATEILTLTQKHSSVRAGIDAWHTPDQVLHLAQDLVSSSLHTIIISGQIDYVISTQQTLTIPFGSHLMSSVTGMGCSLTGLIAAFCAIHHNKTLASYYATLYFGLSGEITAEKTKAPASFKVQFLDNLYQPDLENLKKLYHTKKDKNYGS